MNLIYHNQSENLRRIFEQALANSQPFQLVGNFIRIEDDVLFAGSEKFPLKDDQHIWVLGSGKAASGMAKALEGILGDRLHDGLIIHPRGGAPEDGRVRRLQASHPIPGSDSLEATKHLVSLARRVQPGDLVIYVMSGGSSALLCMPAEGISLESIQKAHELLLNSGANIHEINTVRKHISAVKGGRLGHMLKGANVITLSISDVPGDVYEDIGSGPLVADTTTFADAMAVLDRYGLLNQVPEEITLYLKKGVDGEVAETPKAAIKNHHYFILGNAAYTAGQARREAESLGYTTFLSKQAYSGHTHEIADEICSKALAVKAGNGPVTKPAALIWYGESYLNITGKGRGGRNQEMALKAAMALDGHHYISMLSAGTDGRDGPTDAAGAICNGDTARAARLAGLDPQSFLRDNDSYSFFEALGGLVKTGGTDNNVMDLQVVLVD